LAPDAVSYCFSHTLHFVKVFDFCTAMIVNSNQLWMDCTQAQIDHLKRTIAILQGIVDRYYEKKGLA
jgi:hypothetical protein